MTSEIGRLRKEVDVQSEDQSSYVSYEKRWDVDLSRESVKQKLSIKLMLFAGIWLVDLVHNKNIRSEIN